MEFNFCRRCGKALKHTGGSAYSCEAGHILYAGNTSTTGIFFVNEKNEVLLSVRGIEPNKGMLDSFGGFLELEESFEEAAERELSEELGLKADQYEEPKYLTSAVGHYLYEGENVPIVSVFYWSRLLAGVVPVPADDVERIETIPIDDVDLALLHDDDTRAGLEMLRKVLKEG